MSHRKRKKNRNYSEDFELICRLARMYNVEGLHRVLRRGRCIALRQQLMTPVMQMAIEGNDRAVWMLIHEFNACIQQAVEGYARAQRHEQVEDLLARGADINAAAFGYAITGNDVRAAELMRRGCKPAAVARGYAYGGHTKLSHPFMSQNFTPEVMADVAENMLQGLAYQGLVVEVEKKLQDMNVQEAMIGYAVAGRVKEVEELLRRGGDINDAIFGYARGGYVPEVENLIIRGGSLIPAIEGYAASGMVDQIRKLHVSIVSVVHNFASKGVHHYIEQIFRGDHSSQLQILQEAAAGYESAGYFANEKIIVRLLSAMRDATLRTELARAAERSNVTLNSNEILRKSNQIITMMQKFKINYDQALILQTPGLIAWLLQGQLLPLYRDIHLKIAADMAHTSCVEMNIIAAIVTAKTHDGAVKMLQKKHSPGFFQQFGCFGYNKKITEKKVQDEIKELDSRYQTSYRRTGIVN